MIFIIINESLEHNKEINLAITYIFEHYVMKNKKQINKLCNK
jgi:hypothetical protein